MNGRAKTEDAAEKAAAQFNRPLIARTRIRLVGGLSYDVEEPFEYVAPELRIGCVMEVTVLRVVADEHSSVPTAKPLVVAIPAHAVVAAIDLVD